MNKEIIEKYSVYRKQSKVGALVFLFDSIRKNAVNFLLILVPTGFDLVVFVIVALVFVFILAIPAYINYYFFEYSFLNELIISFFFAKHSIILFALTLPFCLSPIFIVPI